MDLDINFRYLLIEEMNAARVFLADPATGNLRVLEFTDAQKTTLVGLRDKGCSLLLRDENNRIAQFDLKGKLIREVIPAGWYSGPGASLSGVTSLDETWLAYITGQGAQAYAGFEWMDIETRNLTTGATFRLTTHHGGRKKEWSPDGSWIAFSDFDPNGSTQVFIARPDGTEKKQLTNLDKNASISLLKWSPSGEKLAFGGASSEGASFGIISLNSIAPGYKTYLGFAPRNLWWEGENTVILHTIQFDNDMTSHDQEAIILFDAANGQILDTLVDKDTPEGEIISSHSFTPGTVAFFSSYSFFTYDFQTHTFTRHFDNYFNYTSWRFAPEDFPGETNCPMFTPRD